MVTRPTINQHSLVALSFTVRYQSVYGNHSDTLHFEKFNVWRDADLLPMSISQAINGQTAGFRASFDFEKDEITEPYRSQRVYRINNSDFNRQPREGLYVEPRQGRYYPRGWFAGIRDNYSENMFPARIISLDDQHIEVDFNHPLAGIPLAIDVEVLDVYASGDEHGGRCNDCMADVLSGPGMQLRVPPVEQSQPVDFFADHALDKNNDVNDVAFYQLPRLINHLDTTALEQVQLLYQTLLPDNARILDLMSSINSHLPAQYHAAHVTGLGMNLQELDANPILNERRVHDLNADPHLPFDDDSFDVVICNLSIEYLSQPFEVFRDVKRVLSAGGLFVIVFSNRWFPGMTTNLWPDLHEFERLGLVSEYFLQSGGFEDLHSFSLRGFPRPPEDRHKQIFSDPVYAVWASTTE